MSACAREYLMDVRLQLNLTALFVLSRSRALQKSGVGLIDSCKFSIMRAVRKGLPQRVSAARYAGCEVREVLHFKS
jgi:hypothetical protein